MPDTLESIYSTIPKIQCLGLCTDACGPILASDAERRAITRAHGSFPSPLPNLSCDKLSQGRCSIYNSRPLICRLWGVTREMQCPFGCVPERWLTGSEAHALMVRAERLKS